MLDGKSCFAWLAPLVSKLWRGFILVSALLYINLFLVIFQSDTCEYVCHMVLGVRQGSTKVGVSVAPG